MEALKWKLSIKSIDYLHIKHHSECWNGVYNYSMMGNSVMDQQPKAQGQRYKKKYTLFIFLKLNKIHEKQIPKV